jgi:hypothetical protein
MGLRVLKMDQGHFASRLSVPVSCAFLTSPFSFNRSALPIPHFASELPNAIQFSQTLDVLISNMGLAVLRRHIQRTVKAHHAI